MNAVFEQSWLVARNYRHPYAGMRKTFVFFRWANNFRRWDSKLALLNKLHI
jgi:hypothetical protein